MGFMDRFVKKDPDVIAAEQRAFEDEKRRVDLERKNQAIRDAAAKGKARARGGGGSSGVEGAALKVGNAALKVGNAALKVGKGVNRFMEWGANRQGTADMLAAGNEWGFGSGGRQQRAPKTGHKSGGKGKKASKQHKRAQPAAKQRSSDPRDEFDRIAREIGF